MRAEAEADLSRRQLAWLPHWFAKGHWTAPETAALLVGFLPPEPGNTKPLGPWLPGRDPEAWPHHEAWELIVQRDLDHAREWLATISDLGTKRPVEVLALAIKAGIMPPWMRAFLASRHEKCLPRDLRAKARAALGGETTAPGTNPQSDAAYEKLYKQFPDWDEDMREIARLTGEGMQVGHITDKLGRDVRHLVAEFRKAGTAEAIKAAAEAKTAGFCDWKERTGKA